MHFVFVGESSGGDGGGGSVCTSGTQVYTRTQHVYDTVRCVRYMWCMYMCMVY